MIALFLFKHSNENLISNLAGRVQVSDTSYLALMDLGGYKLVKRGIVDVKVCCCLYFRQLNLGAYSCKMFC